MRKSTALALVANVIGIIAMLIPIFAFSLFPAAKYGGVFTSGASASEQIRGLGETAQVLGRIDFGLVSFPHSLVFAALMVISGFLAAVGVWFSLKQKENVRR